MVDLLMVIDLVILMIKGVCFILWWVSWRKLLEVLKRVFVCM